MPYLYGQPFKHELRAEIRELRSELWKSRKEHRDTRMKLQWARLKIEELEAINKRIEQKAREILSDATQDIGPGVKERFIQSLKRGTG